MISRDNLPNFDCKNESEIMCPYCGYTWDPGILYEINDGTQEYYICHNCNKAVLITILITFLSRKGED